MTTGQTPSPSYLNVNRLSIKIFSELLMLSLRVKSSPGGAIAWKMYTPARTAPRNPYPHWYKICETLPLLAQKSDNEFQWDLLTHCGKTCLRTFPSWITGMALSMNSVNFAQFLTFYTLPGTTTGKKHTLSGTDLVFKTLPLV